MVDGDVFQALADYIHLGKGRSLPIGPADMLVERRSCRQSALSHSTQPPRPQSRFGGLLR